MVVIMEEWMGSMWRMEVGIMGEVGESSCGDGGGGVLEGAEWGMQGIEDGGLGV